MIAARPSPRPKCLPRASQRGWDLPLNDDLLREVKDDYQQLCGLLQLVDLQLCAPGDEPNGVVVAATLEQLRDRLAVHFTLQLSLGYFDDAVEVAPRLCYRAEALQNEQFKLFQLICQLADQAHALLAHAKETQRRELMGLRERYLTFSQLLGEHDRQERELIYEALCDDIGVGD